MTKFILGKKLGMSQMFDEENKVIPVTVIEAGPCYVIQARTKEKDGYEAVQIGFGETKRANKPRKGHLAKAIKGKDLKYLKEFRSSDLKIEEFKVGDEIRADIFQVGDKIKISSISKGKGFAGVVKRHGFKGAASKTHGTKHTERAPGSIGSTGPQRVFKGTKMGGRMGGERTSTKNLKIAAVDMENNILAIKGAVPGVKGALVEIRG